MKNNPNRWNALIADSLSGTSLFANVHLWTYRSSFHLSGGFNSFPNAEVDDDPCKQEAESQVPLDRTHIIDAVGDLQYFPPAVKCHHKYTGENGSSLFIVVFFTH